MFVFRWISRLIHLLNNRNPDVADVYVLPLSHGRLQDLKVTVFACNHREYGSMFERRLELLVQEWKGIRVECDIHAAENLLEEHCIGSPNSKADIHILVRYTPEQPDLTPEIVGGFAPDAVMSYRIDYMVFNASLNKITAGMLRVKTYGTQHVSPSEELMELLKLRLCTINFHPQVVAM